MMQCDPRAGARSLITEAIGARAGETLAIVAEDPRLGIYDRMAPVCVADVAAELGITPKIIDIGDVEGIDRIPAAVRQALETFDHVLFHARLGDTLRFADIPGRATKTMSYALDIGILGGPACTVPHRVLEKIREAYNLHANAARTWRVTCALGTDISGTQDVEAVAGGKAADFTVKRYPVCAPRPIARDTATGVVALARWLIASGHRRYDDDELPLSEVVLAQVEKGRILDFAGPGKLVDEIRHHYLRVANHFGIEPFVVHSWHAGINPGAYYPMRAETNLERWDKVAFSSPRYLHFHTCGNYAPGEISWIVVDGTAAFDGIEFWRDGAFVFLETHAIKVMLAAEGLHSIEARRDIGID